MHFDDINEPRRSDQQLRVGVFAARSLFVPAIQANSYGMVTMQ